MRVLLLALLASAAAAQEVPLFADDAPLALTLTFDVDAVTSDRSEDPPWYPATLTHTSPDGAATALDVGVRTRGYYRLNYLDCDVPPLRLNIRRRAAEGTVFAGQDKLKLVTHCQDQRPAYEQFALQEYLIYRAYALLTDVSFRTRLVRITYRDAAGEREDVTRYGFLIEEIDGLAERIGAQAVERTAVHPEATDRQQVALMSVFHYLIGNTDWTVSTLHNVRLLYHEARADSLARAGTFDGSASALLAVPYDFDWAGLIDVPYATPDPQLGLASVRERKYLGFCRSADEFRQILDRFRVREVDLYALFRDSPYLEPDVAEASVAYLASFFEQVATERGIERAFLRDCLGG